MAGGNPIKILERRGFVDPTKEWSYGHVSVTCRFIDETKDFWTQTQFEDFVAEMMSERITFENLEQARFTATYLVQEFMRVFGDDRGRFINVDDVFLLAVDLAKKYIDRMDHGDLQYMRAKPDDEGFDENAPPIVDDRGNRKRKKGAKKLLASGMYQAHRATLTRGEMIAKFMDEIGMSKAGATTYFHNNQKVFGRCKVA